MIATAIIKLLIDSTQVSDFVGDRVEPNVLKNDAVYPSIYVLTDKMEKPACQHNSKIRVGTIEIGVYADRYGLAGNVIGAIREALDEYSGFVSGVGLTIMGGKESTDLFDEKDNVHVKTIEYEAVAQIYT